MRRWYGLLAVVEFTAAAVPAAPSPVELRRLLDAAVWSGAEAKREADARLRSLVRRYPGIFREEVVRLRTETAALVKLLGEEAGVDGVDLFFEGKLREAQEAYRVKDYASAQVLCESILHLGAGMDASVGVRAKRLLRLARDRAFAGGTLFVDLRADKEIIQGTEELRLVLAATNRSEQPVTLEVAGNGILGQLELSFTMIRPLAPISGFVVTEQLRVATDRISVGPGESWEHAFAVQSADRSEESFAIQRISVRGRLVPARIEVGGRTVTRPLRVPLVVVLRVPEGRSEVARDPLRGATNALESGDAEQLFLGTVLSYWEGQIEAVVALLLLGTDSPSPQIAGTSFTLLRLLTGQNFGEDRVRWIKFLLSYEELPLAGPLKEW